MPRTNVGSSFEVCLERELNNCSSRYFGCGRACQNSEEQALEEVYGASSFSSDAMVERSLQEKLLRLEKPVNLGVPAEAQISKAHFGVNPRRSILKDSEDLQDGGNAFFGVPRRSMLQDSEALQNGSAKASKSRRSQRSSRRVSFDPSMESTLIEASSMSDANAPSKKDAVDTDNQYGDLFLIGRNSIGGALAGLKQLGFHSAGAEEPLRRISEGSEEQPPFLKNAPSIRPEEPPQSTDPVSNQVMPDADGIVDENLPLQLPHASVHSACDDSHLIAKPMPVLSGEPPQGTLI